MELTNLKLEAAILGAIINNDKIYYKTIDTLSIEMFSDELNQKLFKCVEELIEESGAISKVKLFHRFANVVDTNGDELKKNFVEITSDYGSSIPLGIKSHVKTLADLYQRRQLQEICQDITQQVTEEGDSYQIASEALSQITDIISSTAQDNSVSMGSVFENIYNNVKSEKPPYNAKTGLHRLDAALGGGLQKGRVYSFVAKSKCGKTMLAATISNSLCDSGNKHAFICAEMGSEEIGQRMLGQRLGVSTESFRIRKDYAFQEQIAQVAVKVKNVVLFEDEPGIEFDRLKAVIEKHVYKNKIEGFILDYYQLVSGQQKSQSQAQHLENVANWVHRVCKKHKIWCVLLVQANDEGQVLGSRGLDRACDQKYMIERPLDEQGDPIGNKAWIKMKLSRYTRLMDLGNEMNPMLSISLHGTHMEEI